MHIADDDRYTYRETYFIYFDGSTRPKLPVLRKSLQSHAPFLNIIESKSEPDGKLLEMDIASYDDHAAVEIIYRNGPEIQNETHSLVAMLQRDASPEDIEKLSKLSQCHCRFDVIHYEQSADSGVFNVVKMPVLKFAKQSTAMPDKRDALAQALNSPRKEPKFFFDPITSTQPQDEVVGYRSAQFLDADEQARIESAVYERVNPDTLVMVIEVLCHASKGIAVDPATGILM